MLFAISFLINNYKQRSTIKQKRSRYHVLNFKQVICHLLPAAVFVTLLLLAIVLLTSVTMVGSVLKQHRDEFE